MDMQDKVITLRYCDIPTKEGLLLDALHPETSKELKFKSLKTLHIEPKDNEKPSDAWLRTMCAENGLEFTRPVPRPMADALQEQSGAFKFYFWLV